MFYSLGKLSPKFVIFISILFLSNLNTFSKDCSDIDIINHTAEFLKKNYEYIDFSHFPKLTCSQDKDNLLKEFKKYEIDKSFELRKTIRTQYKLKGKDGIRPYSDILYIRVSRLKFEQSELDELRELLLKMKRVVLDVRGLGFLKAIEYRKLVSTLLGEEYVKNIYQNYFSNFKSAKYVYAKEGQGDLYQSPKILKDYDQWLNVKTFSENIRSNFLEKSNVKYEVTTIFDEHCFAECERMVLDLKINTNSKTYSDSKSRGGLLAFGHMRITLPDSGLLFYYPAGYFEIDTNNKEPSNKGIAPDFTLKELPTDIQDIVNFEQNGGFFNYFKAIF